MQTSEENDFKLQHCADTLISKLSESLNDKESKLVGTALQARMIAEIFQENVAKYIFEQNAGFTIPQNFDIFTLYEKFIKRKIEIARTEKTCQSDLTEFDIIQAHEKYAFKTIFGENVANKQKCEDLHKFGIVSMNYNAFPHFTHRSFAEYFVASMLIQNISSVYFIHIVSSEYEFDAIINFIDSGIKHKLLEFLDDEELFKKIAAIIDGHLEISIESSIREAKMKFRTVDLEQRKKFLHRLILKENVYLVKFLLKCLPHCRRETTENDFISIFDDSGNNIFHLAATTQIKSLIEEIWNCVERIY